MHLENNNSIFSSKWSRITGFLAVILLVLLFNNSNANPVFEIDGKQVNLLNEFERELIANRRAGNTFGNESAVRKYFHLIEDAGIKDTFQIQEMYFYLISASINNSDDDEVNLLLEKVRSIVSDDDHAQLAEYYYWLGRSSIKGTNDQESFDPSIKGIYHAKKGGEKEFLARFYYDRSIQFWIDGDLQGKRKYRLLAAESIPDDSKFAAFYKGKVGLDYTILKKYTKADEYFTKALNTLVDDAWDWKSGTYPSIEKINRLKYYPEILQYRAYYFREFAKQTPDSIYYLKRSLEDSEESIRVLNQIKSSFVFDMDLLKVNESSHYSYYKTIEVLSRLYKATNDKSYLERAFQYSELEKASALIMNLQRQQALNNSGLSSEEINKANALQLDIAHLDAEINGKNTIAKLKIEDLTALHLRMYDLVEEAKAHEKHIEEINSAYKTQKNASLLQDLNFVKGISKEKAVLEYVLSDEKLYSFCIVDEELHYNEQRVDEDFPSKVEALHQLIAETDNLVFNMQELENYQKLANEMYEHLIAPFENIIANKPLLIIPDEQLSLIPFEALVKNEVSLNAVDYTKLDYLVKHHDVSYSYSLALLSKQMEPNVQTTNKQVLAVAPTYDKLNENMGSQYLALRDSRNGLAMLKGAKQEVQNIRDKVKGRTVFENAATEQLFKEEAKNYAVLHLAMHTLVDDEDPFYSKLVFTPEADAHEDGLLNTYELAELDLNADMVVLSACNTGYGKLHTGEGIIGLSRGFFLAGSNSLVATLWSVPDHTSKSIINEFYTNLKKRENKAYSISDAKRDFINETNGMFGHPFFWAGYVNIGNADAIKLESAGMGLASYAGIIGVALLLLLFVRFKNLHFPTDFLGFF